MATLAREYDVPARWIECVLLPENDIDSCYGWPSDRTETAEAELVALTTAHQQLREQIAQIQKIEKKHICSSCDLSDEDRARREGWNRAITVILESLVISPATKEP